MVFLNKSHVSKGVTIILAMGLLDCGIKTYAASMVAITSFWLFSLRNKKQ